MLEQLEIKNLGPIRSAEVAFSPRMTAITGETGAGKSMLLNALKLVRGGAADSAKVSSGQTGTWAQAVFDVNAAPQARRLAEEAGVSVEDDEVFLTRQVPQSGRSKAILCGHTVPRSVLQEISEQLITVHGQSDQLRLVSPARQRDFLDTYAADSSHLNDYARAWQKLHGLETRLSQLSSQQADARQRADYLRESIEYIERIDPQPYEDDELKLQRDRIENSAAIAESVGGALAALDSSQVGDQTDTPSVVSLLAAAVASLRGVHDLPDLAQAADELDDVNTKISDIVFSLSSQLESTDVSDSDLDHLNERIHDLNELTRRWGPGIQEVREWLEKARFELEDVDASPEKVEEVRRARDGARTVALQAARKLHTTRRAAAAMLAERVTEELSSLSMPGARLNISVEARSGDDALGPSGIDDVSFLFTPFPGAGERPLGKSASGGELSRLMLAMELALAETLSHSAEAGNSAPAMTFVFDEVDAGVGGEAAVELGKRLARLAQSAQVIVVTHLAQVASWADAQFVVEKAARTSGAVETQVTQVLGETREEEIARMLSGSDSQTSLDHARELLATSVLEERQKNKA